MDTESIILAVASPPGRAPRGIVRGSGPETFALLRNRLESAGDDGRPLAPTRGLHRAVLRLSDGRLPVLALVLPGPHSYTGEDSIELHGPGAPWLLDRVIDDLIEEGRGRGLDVRRAGPGEFTARAYLHGRLDLAEAEAVATTIAARSDAELTAARILARGDLARLARDVADTLTDLLALVEVGIDFTDQDDVVPVAPAALVAGLETARRRLAERLVDAVGLARIEAIPWVVLAGPPNAGKSTLFNALLGRERAVVSAAAGTTRDVLAEPLALGQGADRAEVLLVDVAGADDARDALGAAMQAGAGRAVERADLVLRCIPPEADAAAAPGADDRTVIVRTKADLGGSGKGGDVAVSAREGTGLGALRDIIAARLADAAVSLAADAAVLVPRHESALRGAIACLEEAAAAADDDGTGAPELVAAGLRGALDELGHVTGTIDADDVLDRVFARFCIGK